MRLPLRNHSLFHPFLLFTFYLTTFHSLSQYLHYSYMLSNVEFLGHLEVKFSLLLRSLVYWTGRNSICFTSIELGLTWSTAFGLWASALSDRLNPMPLGQNVYSLCISYRFYRGECSKELFVSQFCFISTTDLKFSKQVFIATGNSVYNHKIILLNGSY